MPSSFVRVTLSDGSVLGYQRGGAGEPLLLIHANGMSRAAWAPVLPLLEPRHDVIAIDLPGHGDSGLIARHLVPAPPGFARVFAALLDVLGIDRAHIAGNSLGGWTALELAKLERALSVCALGPAGLWDAGPVWPVFRLALPYLSVRRWPFTARRALRNRALRMVLLRHAFGYPQRISAADATRIATDLERANGFLATLLATHGGRFSGGQGIDVPVTVVFGRRDRVVPSAARRSDQLPSATRWVDPPTLGHVPMWDDPRAVAELISETAVRGSPTR